MSEKQFRVEQVDHIELYVPDQDEAAKWYKEVFGMEVMPEFRFWAEEGGPLMISSDGGSTKLALFQGEAPGFRPLPGFRRVAFRVDGPGFIVFLRRLQTRPVFSHTGEQVKRLEVVDHDKAYSVYFCDPYGNRYEVTSYEYEYISQHAS